MCSAVSKASAQAPHRAFQLSVAQQQLHRPQVLGLPVDNRCLGAPERMGAIIGRVDADAGDLWMRQGNKLPSPFNFVLADPAFHDVARLLSDIELHRLVVFFLHDNGSPQGLDAMGDNVPQIAFPRRRLMCF